MRTVSFFNSKGGSGKSLHSVMFASWLAYHEGARVAFLDCENPTPRVVELRNTEISLLDDSSSWLSRFIAKLPEEARRDFYEIIRLPGIEGEYSRQNLMELHILVSSFLEENNDKYDYAVFDLPCFFNEVSASFQILSSNAVDLIVVPFDVDSSTRKEALIVSDLLKRNEQNVVGFWNNVSVSDLKRKGYLDSGEKIFEKYGIDILPERIKSFAKAKRDSDERLFVKSTVCWPDRYVQMACPELVSLYMDIKDRLDRF